MIEVYLLSGFLGSGKTSLLTAYYWPIEGTREETSCIDE